MATCNPRVRPSDGVTVWDVRWYPRVGRNQKSKTFTDEDDAQEFKREVERALDKGEPEPEPARRSKPDMTLGEFYVDSYRPRYWNRLLPNTQSKYRSAWNQHITDERYGIA